MLALEKQEYLGPRRRGSRSQRNVNHLLGAQLVEPTTSLLGENVRKQFCRWCSRFLSDSDFAALSRHPPCLCQMIGMFGGYLFEEGHSLYLLRHLKTFVQRMKPEFRGQLSGAWMLVYKWEQVQPVSQRPPLPLVIYHLSRRGINCTATWLVQMVGLGIFILGFKGNCRPGEPLAAYRSDLLLPRDLVVEDSSTVYLRIRKPKGRRRGLGSVQHSKITCLEVARFLDFAFGQLPGGERLFPGSAAAFRSKWDYILGFVLVLQKFDLTPACVRGGGAAVSYRSDGDLTRLMWKMRIKGIHTLQHYLQEVGASSIFIQLPKSSRDRISKAALLYTQLINLF